MINVPFDLDTLEDQLIQFRKDCMELAVKAVKAAVAKGVPASALGQFTPDFGEQIDWTLCPDVLAHMVEFNGEQYRYGDVDYTFFRVDRRLIEGTKTFEEWANEQKRAYDQAKEEHLKDIQAKDRAERESRRRLYEDLRKEFENDHK